MYEESPPSFVIGERKRKEQSPGGRQRSPEKPWVGEEMNRFLRSLESFLRGVQSVFIESQDAMKLGICDREVDTCSDPSTLCRPQPHTPHHLRSVSPGKPTWPSSSTFGGTAFEMLPGLRSVLLWWWIIGPSILRPLISKPIDVHLYL